MNKRFLEQLKTKAKTFGFSDEEVDNAVAMLSKLNPNLNNDDLSDEEINSSIEAVIPMFKSAQSHSDRVVRNKDNENKKAVEQLNAKIKELESKKKQQNEEEHGGDEVSDAILKRLEALEQQNKSLSENLLKTQTENLSQQRLSMFKDKLKDADKTWLKSAEKQFSRMTFKDEEDFNTYLEDVVKDAQEFAQDRANAGLSSFTKVKGGNGGKEGVREIVSDVMHERLKANGVEINQE